jgi:hypothetical protein
MKQQSPSLNDADAVDYPTLSVFIPDGGDRKATAYVLVEAAEQNGLPQSHVRSDASRRGFWISDALADIVYDDSAEEEPAPKTPAKAPAKTGSTAKKGTKKQ